MTNRYYKEINGEQVFFSGKILYTDTETILNPTDELMLENGWTVYVAPEPDPEELITLEKNKKLKRIEIYDKSQDVNVFYLNDIPMWLDAPTRLLLRTSINAYLDTGITNVTKWFLGQQFTFPINLWILMLNALEVYAAEALNVTESHKAAVSALTTLEEILNYDITANYPEKLNFNPQWLLSHT